VKIPAFDDIAWLVVAGGTLPSFSPWGGGNQMADCLERTDMRPLKRLLNV